MPKQMKSFIDLDWVTFECPCGASLYTDGVSHAEFNRWMAEHKPHTNGELLETVTDDGARCLSKRPAPRTVPLT